MPVSPAKSKEPAAANRGKQPRHTSSATLCQPQHPLIATHALPDNKQAAGRLPCIAFTAEAANVSTTSLAGLQHQHTMLNLTKQPIATSSYDLCHAITVWCALHYSTTTDHTVAAEKPPWHVSLAATAATNRLQCCLLPCPLVMMPSITKLLLTPPPPRT